MTTIGGACTRAVAVGFILLALAGPGTAETAAPQALVAPPAAPAACPADWLPLLGIYGSGDDVVLVLESDGALKAMVKGGRFYALEAVGGDQFRFPNQGRFAARSVTFVRDGSGKPLALRLDAAVLPRTAGANGSLPRLKLARPLTDALRDARAASPPIPSVAFAPDLVDVAGLDGSLRLELRYASDANPLGEVLLKGARALLQRPAAEAVVRAHHALRPLGYGLVIHDAYHPWWLSRLVWDASPLEERRSLADAPEGSGYNRGTAVDVSLFRLADGRPCELPSLYGEMSLRAYLDFPGGTSLQRWHRDLLVEAMETAGLSSGASQWWRYELPDGGRYPVLNLAPDTPIEAGR